MFVELLDFPWMSSQTGVRSLWHSSRGLSALFWAQPSDLWPPSSDQKAVRAVQSRPGDQDPLLSIPESHFLEQEHHVGGVRSQHAAQCFHWPVPLLVCVWISTTTMSGTREGGQRPISDRYDSSLQELVVTCLSKPLQDIPTLKDERRWEEMTSP